MWLKVGLSILTIHFHSNQSIMLKEKQHIYFYFYLGQQSSQHEGDTADCQ